MPREICPAHDDLKDLIEAKFTMLHAEVLAGNDLLYREIKSVQERQDRTNGRVMKLEEIAERRNWVDWFYHNWKWAAVGLAGFIILVVNINLSELIKILRP